MRPGSVAHSAVGSTSGNTVDSQPPHLSTAQPASDVRTDADDSDSLDDDVFEQEPATTGSFAKYARRCDSQYGSFEQSASDGSVDRQTDVPYLEPRPSFPTSSPLSSLSILRALFAHELF